MAPQLPPLTSPGAWGAREGFQAVSELLFINWCLGVLAEQWGEGKTLAGLPGVPRERAWAELPLGDTVALPPSASWFGHLAVPDKGAREVWFGPWEFPDGGRDRLATPQKPAPTLALKNSKTL